MRRGDGRAQTLIEVIVAIALLSVIVVMITADLTNITKADSAADRSIEISSANFLIGVMKADPGFWGSNGTVDWNVGPQAPCYQALGPYTDTGPSPTPSSTPSWHSIPSPQPNCAFPFTDQGAPQEGQPGPNDSPAPVGDTIQYMWNASVHNGDPNAADLTVWVRRDPNAPIYEYHSVRYLSPGPAPSGSPGQGGGGGGGGGGNGGGGGGQGFGV